MPTHYTVVLPGATDRPRSGPLWDTETLITLAPGHPVRFRGTTLTFEAHEPTELPFLLALGVDGPARCDCLELYRALTEPFLLSDRLEQLPLTFRTNILARTKTQVAEHFTAAGMTVGFQQTTDPDGLLLHTPAVGKRHAAKTTLAWFWLFDLGTPQPWRFNQLEDRDHNIIVSLFRDQWCGLCGIPPAPTQGAARRFRRHLQSPEHVRQCRERFTALNAVAVPVLAPLVDAG
jgi:hypothetical protein